MSSKSHGQDGFSVITVSQMQGLKQYELKLTSRYNFIYIQLSIPEGKSLSWH